MYVDVLNFGGRRYFWLALLLAVASVALYCTQDASLPPNGGSWQGYTLGGVALALILWLAWLGIRKRQYRRQSGRIEAWTSAHVYLGLTLPIIATLHAGFQLGPNVHTLAWALMMAVIASGIYGLYAYLRFPGALVRNRGNASMDQRLAELDGIDKELLDTAARCDEEAHAVVRSALERTAVGGGFRDQLLARDRSRVILPGTGKQVGKQLRRPNAYQAAVIDYLSGKIPNTSKRLEAERLQALLASFGRRAEILARVRREQSLMLRLKLWLCFHIPLTLALITALIAHVVTVFFYW